MAGTKPKRVLLQDRDHRLLHELDTMRVIDREQAKAVGGFGSTTRANTRLLALTRAGLLRRLNLPGNRAAYQLAAARQRPGKTSSAAEAVLFAEHQLAINEVLLAVRYRPLPQGLACITWQRFTQPLAASLPLIPDAYFELESSAGLRACFLELDLGTEAVSVLRRKFRLYVELAVSGEFERLFGRPQFRVLVVTTTERRVEHLRQAAAQITDKIFWLTTRAAAQHGGFWHPIWHRPKLDQSFTLT